MKLQKAILILVICLGLFALAGTQDDRMNPMYPVARYQFAQQSWETSGGHGAASVTLQRVSGTIYRIDVIISSVTANPTVVITWADQNSVVIVPDALCAALADGTNHYFLAESNKATRDADFNPVPHEGNIVLSIDPSADPGGTTQTLTVDVILYVR